MYKNFMLYALLITAFSNSQLLHSSEDPSKPIRQAITFVMTKIGENSSYISTKISETYQELSTNENVNKAVIGITINIAGAVIFKVGDALYNSIYPRPEDNARQAEAEVRIQEAKKRLEYLKSEANFRTCLKSIKKDAPQNAEGIPTKCEEQARALILCGGKVAVHNMMNDFNS